MIFISLESKKEKTKPMKQARLSFKAFYTYLLSIVIIILQQLCVCSQFSHSVCTRFG